MVVEARQHVGDEAHLLRPLNNAPGSTGPAVVVDEAERLEAASAGVDGVEQHAFGGRVAELAASSVAPMPHVDASTSPIS